MLARPWLCLVATLVSLCPSPQADLDINLHALEPLRHIPEVVFAYPFMLKRYPGIIDFLVSVGAEYVYANKYDRVTVPNVEKSITVSVKGISYSTTFTGKYGWLENLSTLTRVSDVIVQQYRPGSVSVSTSLSFKSLTFGFDKYSIPLGFILSLSGQINIKINKNKIGMKLLITANKDTKKCSFSLEELEIEELGDFRATITGLYPFNWIYSIIVNMVINDNKSIVRGYLEGKFTLEMRYFVMQLPCGHT